MTDISPSALRSPSVGRASVLALIVVGAVLWALAVLFIRWAGPLGAFRAPAVFILYALTVPASFPIWAAGGRGVDAPQRVLFAVSVMSATALLLDGVAFASFRNIYGGDPTMVAGAGGWLLWAVGVALVLALIAPLLRRGS